MSEIRRAITAFIAPDAAPVAPQIAIRLASYAHHDDDALAMLARELTSAQLAGRSQLPDPLPYVAAPGITRALESLTPAQHRLLLTAALAATDLIAVVLDAAAVDIDTLLAPELTTAIRIRAGQFRFVDQRVRSGLIRTEDPALLRRINAALARAARRAGQSPVAAWHSALASESLEPSSVRALVQIAEQQLELGAVESAQRIATRAAAHATSETRPAAIRTASRAALWAGHLDDAREIAESGTRLRADDHLAATTRVSRMLLDGAPACDDPRKQVIAHYVPLAAVAAGAEDARAIGTLVEMANLWWLDPDGTDALQAGLTLTTRRAHGSSAILREQRAPSPLAEAHVRLMQAAFQLQAGDFEGARSTLEEAIPRLPLVVPAAGVVASLIEMAIDPSTVFDAALADAYRAVSPPATILYNAYGPETGKRTTAVARRVLPVPTQSPSSSPAVGADLTPRERDVVALLTEGLSNGAIASRLGISARTIEVHLSRVYRKLGVHTRSGLIALMLRNGAPTSH